MRSFVPTSGFSGHDQFFATFARFSGLKKSHAGEWVDEVAARAAAQNQQYLELMQTPPFSHAAQIARQLGFDADFAPLPPSRSSTTDCATKSPPTATTCAPPRPSAPIEHCGTPQAAPACQVEIRYIYQVLRGSPPEQVFAQTLLGFETVQASIDANDSTLRRHQLRACPKTASSPCATTPSK